MSERVVYFNGRFVPEAQACVSIYDSALVVGDMAYDVTRTVRRQPFMLPQHVARLYHTLAALRIDPGLSPVELERLTVETLNRNLPTEADDVDFNIIHNISRGPASGFRGAVDPSQQRPTVIVSCYPLIERLARLAKAYDEGIDVLVPAQRSVPASVLDPSIKVRSRVHFQLANLEAEARGAWAVLADLDGFLTEATSGNLFVVRDGELLTPTARDILPGLTRELVLQLATRIGVRCREADIAPQVAATADEVFVTSTSVGILHARTFDGQTIGDRSRGPVTRELSAALTVEVGLDFAAQAREYAQRLAQARS